MTKPMMDLRALVEKSAYADLLREMIGFAAERLMELEGRAAPLSFLLRRCLTFLKERQRWRQIYQQGCHQKIIGMIIRYRAGIGCL